MPRERESFSSDSNNRENSPNEEIKRALVIGEVLTFFFADEDKEGSFPTDATFNVPNVSNGIGVKQLKFEEAGVLVSAWLASLKTEGGEVKERKVAQKCLEGMYEKLQSSSTAGSVIKQIEKDYGLTVGEKDLQHSDVALKPGEVGVREKKGMRKRVPDEDEDNKDREVAEKKSSKKKKKNQEVKPPPPPVDDVGDYEEVTPDQIILSEPVSKPTVPTDTLAVPDNDFSIDSDEKDNGTTTDAADVWENEGGASGKTDKVVMGISDKDDDAAVKQASPRTRELRKRTETWKTEHSTTPAFVRELLRNFKENSSNRVESMLLNKQHAVNVKELHSSSAEIFIRKEAKKTGLLPEQIKAFLELVKNVTGKIGAEPAELPANDGVVVEKVAPAKKETSGDWEERCGGGAKLLRFTLDKFKKNLADEDLEKFLLQKRFQNELKGLQAEGVNDFVRKEAFVNRLTQEQIARFQQLVHRVLEKAFPGATQVDVVQTAPHAVAASEGSEGDDLEKQDVKTVGKINGVKMQSLVEKVETGTDTGTDSVLQEEESVVPVKELQSDAQASLEDPFAWLDMAPKKLEQPQLQSKPDTQKPTREEQRTIELRVMREAGWAEINRTLDRIESDVVILASEIRRHERREERDFLLHRLWLFSKHHREIKRKMEGWKDFFEQDFKNIYRLLRVVDKNIVDLKKIAEKQVSTSLNASK